MAMTGADHEGAAFVTAYCQRCSKVLFRAYLRSAAETRSFGAGPIREWMTTNRRMSLVSSTFGSRDVAPGDALPSGAGWKAIVECKTCNRRVSVSLATLADYLRNTKPNLRI